jgi:Flp pilus assembly protein TadG
VRFGNGAGQKGKTLRRGASAVELALVLPLFVSIVLACIDFGRFAYNYIAVANAARAAGAWAMMNPPADVASPSAAWKASVAQAAINEMSQQPGVKASNITIAVGAISTEAPYGTWRFQVTASYPFQTLVKWGFSGLGIPQSLTLEQTVVLRGIRP